MVAGWQPGTSYVLGDVVEYNGKRYKIIQAHVSEATWTPDVTPALWGLIPEDDWSHHEPYEPPHGTDTDYHKAEVPPRDYTSNPDQTVEVPHEERKKNWYDIDDKRKKQLEVGGGLVAGLALLGGGYYAYEHHKQQQQNKTPDQQQAAAWGFQNWLHDAQARTEGFRNRGPQGPTTWVLTEGTQIPKGALVGGTDANGNSIYIARAWHEESIQIGKAAVFFKQGAAFGYAESVVEVSTYEVLLGDPRGVYWAPVSGRFSLAALGGRRPVEGGREADGTQLFIAQVRHNGGTHPAKVSERLPGASLAFNGTEVSFSEYSVLTYA